MTPQERIEAFEKIADGAAKNFRDALLYMLTRDVHVHAFDVFQGDGQTYSVLLILKPKEEIDRSMAELGAPLKPISSPKTSQLSPRVPSEDQYGRGRFVACRR